jgi:Mn-dependent DtxR family transcriptional regulator
VEIRMMVLRLERAGLVQSDASMTIEVTDAGRAVLEPRSSL